MVGQPWRLQRFWFVMPGVITLWQDSICKPSGGTVFMGERHKLQWKPFSPLTGTDCPPSGTTTA